MAGKSTVISKYDAKYSGILPRVDMPHFQYLVQPLNFCSTCCCALYNIGYASFLSIMRTAQLVRIFFKRGYYETLAYSN
jgi:hypothetical protein